MFGSRKAKWAATRHSVDAPGEKVDVTTLIQKFAAEPRRTRSPEPEPEPEEQPDEGPVATVTPLFGKRDRK